MHGSNETDHDDSGLAGEIGSATLSAGMAAGEAIASTVRGSLEAKLTPGQRDRLHHLVAGLAARGAYAGLALWALNALIGPRERLARLSEAVAGVSIGVLSGQPDRSPLVRR